MSRPRRRLLPSSLVAALALASPLLALVTARPASAEDSVRQTWSIQPATTTGVDTRPWFSAAVTPGSSSVDYVAVSNYGDRAIELDLYAADGLTNPDGSFALRPRADAAHDLARWISLKQTSVTVPARSRVQVPFSITVPADATPGDHVGGVVASLTTPTIDGQVTAVALEQRVGTRVYLRVAGELRPSVTVEGLDTTYTPSWDPTQGGTTTVHYTVRNDGNARVAVDQQVAVTGLLGLGAQQASVPPLREIAPGGAVQVSVTLPAPTPLVRATADVELVPTVLDASTATASPVAASASTWALPWSQLAALLALAVTAYFLARTARRRSDHRAARHAAELTAAREAGRAEAAGASR